jgi:peptide/nickel transport system substrate-binding protein
MLWVPAIQIGTEAIAQGAVPKYVDMGWLMKCIPFNVSKYTEAAYTLEYPHGMSGASFDTIDPVFLGGFAPQGVVPPLAEAIINGSLWTEYPQYAAFIGLPTPDPELQACVASYFHTTYTPVTTTTTTTAVTTTTTTAVSTVTSTATVTSTVTSTVASTTAVTTVTVTKPVISTALIAGIVIIVIAAVTATIALRRR